MDDNASKNLKTLLRHCEHVKDATQLLAERLAEQGEQPTFCRLLIVKGRAHDATKFFGIEFENLNGESTPELLKLAWHQHVSTNDHHPEYWGSIDAMPRIAVAEMVCDWYARAIEFGTNLRDWIKNEAAEKYGIAPTGKTGKRIKEFVDLLLEEPFKRVK